MVLCQDAQCSAELRVVGGVGGQDILRPVLRMPAEGSVDVVTVKSSSISCHSLIWNPILELVLDSRGPCLKIERGFGHLPCQM